MSSCGGAGVEASPFDGSDISLSRLRRSERRPRAAIEATKRAITQALSLGFRKQDIAVLSFRGREGSGDDRAGSSRPASAAQLYRANTICLGIRNIVTATFCSNRSIVSKGRRRLA